jgi:hypothetical protein
LQYNAHEGDAGKVYLAIERGSRAIGDFASAAHPFGPNRTPPMSHIPVADDDSASTVATNLLFRTRRASQPPPPPPASIEPAPLPQPAPAPPTSPHGVATNAMFSAAALARYADPAPPPSPLSAAAEEAVGRHSAPPPTAEARPAASGTGIGTATRHRMLRTALIPPAALTAALSPAPMPGSPTQPSRSAVRSPDAGSGVRGAAPARELAIAGWVAPAAGAAVTSPAPTAGEAHRAHATAPELLPPAAASRDPSAQRLHATTATSIATPAAASNSTTAHGGAGAGGRALQAGSMRAHSPDGATAHAPRAETESTGSLHSSPPLLQRVPSLPPSSRVSPLPVPRRLSSPAADGLHGVAAAPEDDFATALSPTSAAAAVADFTGACGHAADGPP